MYCSEVFLAENVFKQNNNYYKLQIITKYYITLYSRLQKHAKLSRECFKWDTTKKQLVVLFVQGINYR